MAESAGNVQKLPHDGEAESACLGGLLLKKDMIPEVRSLLEGEHFFFDRNRFIYDAICLIDDRSEPVDILSLRVELQKQKKFDQAGGDEYLRNIYDSVIAADNVMHYARIIHQKSLLRSLIRSSNQILDSCYQGSDDAETILVNAEKKIFDIAMLRRSDDIRILGDVLVETIQDIENLMQNKLEVTGIPSGLKDLDQMTTGFHPGQLIIIGARPGMGKTSLALNIAQHVSIHKMLPVVYFSLEMAASELTMRVLSSESMVDGKKIKTGNIQHREFLRLLNRQNLIREAQFFIDDNPGTTVLDMRAKLMRLQRKVPNLSLVVVDYLQLMRSINLRRGDNRQQELAEISRSLKGLARELKVPIIALTQLGRQVENRPDSEPKLSDIRESGAIEQDADIVIFIHKPKEKENAFQGPGAEMEAPQRPGIMELIIAKHRAGPQGRVKVAFLENLTRFESYAFLDNNIVG